MALSKDIPPCGERQGSVDSLAGSPSGSSRAIISPPVRWAGCSSMPEESDHTKTTLRSGSSENSFLLLCLEVATMCEMPWETKGENSAPVKYRGHYKTEQSCIKLSTSQAAKTAV